MPREGDQDDQAKAIVRKGCRVWACFDAAWRGDVKVLVWLYCSCGRTVVNWEELIE